MNKREKESFMEDCIEAAYWDFDNARLNKAYAERDHYKNVMRKTIRQFDKETNWFTRLSNKFTGRR